MKLTYNWSLKDVVFTRDKGTVFSCFSCGGGSTMGYKLAGFNVLGCNEIDEKMMEVYKKNHNPKYAFLESIRTFKKRKDIPKELYELDILDGSPPCSSFSMSGNRDKDWGRKKKFKEGQAKQILDTLFFDFIDLAKELKPKIVISENVKGLLLGKARSYLKKIYKQFDEAGYYCQHFLINAKNMGIPQNRERVFFICLRKDLAKPFLVKKDMFSYLPKIDIKFNEKEVFWGEIVDMNDKTPSLPPLDSYLWRNKKYGDKDLCVISQRLINKTSRFNCKILYKDKVSNTVTANDYCVLYDIERRRNKQELIKCGSFPLDYQFLGVKPKYIIGMSVPPLMIAKISLEVYNQWLIKIKKQNG